jgi:hypothetical protein
VHLAGESVINKSDLLQKSMTAPYASRRALRALLSHAVPSRPATQAKVDPLRPGINGITNSGVGIAIPSVKAADHAPHPLSPT